MRSEGVSMSGPAVAERFTWIAFKKFLMHTLGLCIGDSGSKEDMKMDVDTGRQTDELIHAFVVALGRTHKNDNSITKFIDIGDGLGELDMERYEDDDEGILGMCLVFFLSYLHRSWYLYYPSNDMDPYPKDKNDDDSEELKDVTFKPKDAIIICSRNEDECSHLEYRMMVIQTYILWAFPLFTAWLDCPLEGEEKGNFIAVGSMDHSIEIWDLNNVYVDHSLTTSLSQIDEVQPS
ncbi:uncharacterized protein LOC131169081 [Hevea brasiliensis]|uniref:uncharacterized protein LOC131169081 n=1 Tax=Hevea brasiliensis TaxID=3981 RepID=UPI0025F52B21|nr:uncharacterized protein LOC131169081 [Hevea brasiliensis]